MNQLRLFPRAERLPVLVLAGSADGDDAGRWDEARGRGAVLTRLRRSRRIDVHPGPAAALEVAGAAAPAAVVVVTEAHPAGLSALRRLVARAGTVPVVAVVEGGRAVNLAVLEAGAEEVVDAAAATGPALERAVLAAVSRRVADRRAGGPEDALTGLSTRARLDAELPDLLPRVGRDGEEVALLYCDLDRLKVVNDSLGHAVGDAVIVEAAQRLRRAVRSADHVVRVGGDEFVVVLRGRGAAAAAGEVARRVVESFADPVEVGDHRLDVGVSVGLAVARPGDDPAHLVDRADRALYLAKRRGRGRVVQADDEAVDGAGERLAGALREAIARDRLEVDRHPVLAAGGGRLLGHRVTAAWAGGIPRTSSGDPATVAEDQGLAPDLFAWTLRNLPADADAVRPTTGGIRNYVELPRSVLAGSPARWLEAAGSVVGASDRLVALVDERHLLDVDAVRSPLLELARAGVRVGVSRFGAVHASLAVLERHPFDSVWLDRDAVEGLASCPIRRARLHAVLAVADALGQQVVAPAPAQAEDRRVLADTGRVALELRSLDLRDPGRTGGSLRDRPATAAAGRR